MKKEKKQAKKTEKDNIYKICIAILLFVVLILAIQNLMLYTKQPHEKTQDIVQNQTQYTTSDISAKLSEHHELEAYSSYKIENIKHMTENEITDYAKKEPVIYEGLTGNNIYSIECFSEHDGLLIIYDADSDTILKMFRTTKISLN
ncbi:MAG: hypothetical protein U9P44_00370 [archaeon]|nr:hypothetical protein [archaeon]